MRRLLLQVSEYDPVGCEEWSYDQPALLITENTLLTVCQSDVEFYYFDKPIGKDVEVVDWNEAVACESVEVKSVEGLALEELATKTLVDLAGLLRKN